MEEKQENRLEFRGGKFMSLIPVLIFFGFCVTLFVFFKAFNMEALAMGGFVALLVGGIFCKSYTKFWDAAIRGISSVTSVSVIVIFFVIGMFSALMKASGLSGGFVWLANNFGIQGGIFVAFVFFATCVMSTATGSSIGTMFTAFPIFYPAGLILGGSPMFLAGAIVSGAIFGDNLAPISDTTIASSSTQQFRNGRPADVGGVVKSRLKYSAVAGLITLVVYALVGGIGGTFQGGMIDAVSNPKSLFMLIPVVIMLIVATKSRNIFLGIFVGLVLGIGTGLGLGLFPASAIFANDAANNTATGFLVSGVASMLGTVGLVISVFGIMGVLTEAGMLEYLVQKILGSKLARTPRGAEIASLIGISLTTVIFGGVTSAS
ncbi:MAG: Na+/H+ antiporter NhaC family protein, partial [Oscillospiraceae bacterium]